MSAVSNGRENDDASAFDRQGIAVTHGLAGHWIVMHPLCRRLRSHGYRVENWGYRSLWKDVRRHAERFTQVLHAFESDSEVDTFHIVAHSMGNILARVALADFQPEKLRRIVMIAPPNKGSPIATMYAPLFGWMSKTIQEIRDVEESFVNQFSVQLDPDYEVGIIQAQTDFVVPIENTRLPEAKEYLMLPGFHSSIVAHSRTAAQVHHFLQEGCFSAE